MNAEEIVQSLRQVKPQLKERFHVAHIGLFGSYARNEQTHSSDIDVLVSFLEPVSGFEFVDLATFLETELKAPVDLISDFHLRTPFRTEIEKDLIYA